MVSFVIAVLFMPSGFTNHLQQSCNDSQTVGCAPLVGHNGITGGAQGEMQKDLD